MTHSIPDSCGIILRSDHGTIVHTGDWKIDENPQDGQVFDRTMFEKIGETCCWVFTMLGGWACSAAEAGLSMNHPEVEVTEKPSVWLADAQSRLWAFAMLRVLMISVQII